MGGESPHHTDVRPRGDRRPDSISPHRFLPAARYLGTLPLARDRVGAAKSVVMIDLAILNAAAAAGMYKKPIEALAREIRYDPLPDECAR